MKAFTWARRCFKDRPERLGRPGDGCRVEGWNLQGEWAGTNSHASHIPDFYVSVHQLGAQLPTANS